MALIALRGVCREYLTGGQSLVVLRDVELEIEAGEFVAIMGPSGSGKSTLMNILGLLDRPSSGSYELDGREVSSLSPDQLAALRRNHFGFIFQRYHLLPDLDARANVEVPAVYAGSDRQARRERALELLGRLGMAERTGHRPGQLSGGQQQRVSIARALMNGGRIVLADEPTGALDTHSGAEVMRILQDLHAEGRTIIMVTHEPEVAAHAGRVIEIRDGVIHADRRTRPQGAGRGTLASAPELRHEGAWEALWDRSREALGMALVAMNAHRMRTFLTMLGIIIGIASVVSVVALGEGSRQAVLANISRIGTNTLDIMPGRDFGDMRSGAVRTLVAADAEALASQPYVDSVTPVVQTGVTLRHGNVAANGQATGVGAQYFRVRGMELSAGRLFGQAAVQGMAQEVVIDSNTRNTLFKGGQAVGRVLLVGTVPCQVVGVVEAAGGGWGGGDSLSVYLPYTTLQARLLGSSTLRSITVRIADDTEPQAAAEAATRLLTRRHGSRDFFIMSSDEIREAITSTTETMTLLISAIAVISLIVGGIGVMNIMLVSVTERTREIGVRMAVGARQSDILQQFLIEAVLVCLAGGALGVLVALAVGLGFSLAGSAFSLVYSTTSIVLAFACSTLIGVVFGYIPARNAARLDPVMALARE